MSKAAHIRPLGPADVDDLYRISLLTGDRGGDASAQYDDPKMIGHIYSAPYAHLHPETCFIAQDDQGVAGFVVGALDTRTYENALETQWWPALRQAHPLRKNDMAPGASGDSYRRHMFHYPRKTPAVVSAAFPGHLHMNLLARLQGQGVGTALFDRWQSAAQQQGVGAICVGAHPQNPRAIGFWQSCGMRLVNRELGLTDAETIWLGKELP